MRSLLALSLMTLALAGLPSPAPAAACDAPSGIWGPFAPLERTQARLAATRSLKVVAIGSSSTYGTGATSREHSYPAQLARILRERFPQAKVEVINAGIGGETVARNLARFDRDVLAHHPDLVIWQVGTNDAFQKKAVQEVYAGVQAGIRQVRAAGAELVLMESQYFPERPETEALSQARATIHQAAADAGVEFLPRYALMRHWIETGLFSPATMLVADKIHMTDASYQCLAERVADLLPATPAAGEPPVTVATSDAPGAAAAGPATVRH
ncbi:SGNH/GDSL hydrolase family protein [Geminicoccus harenae]|uniref:SGNH/GDSL hydrolase family protein n=2 Tax=Geminicoccus harenae TaxID=2498453 RepID=UPI001C9867A8|nr:SGNH/GDSL hydrolase family protein [Geminicoccus harenae]